MAEPRVYRGPQGQPAIHKDDDVKFRNAILTIARPCGGSIFRRIHGALVSSKAHPNAAEIIAYFGDELVGVQEEIRPLVEALEGMIPGFESWLAASGFGNDKDYMLAMLFWARAIKDGKLRGTEREHVMADVAPRPRNYAAEIKATQH